MILRSTKLKDPTHHDGLYGWQGKDQNTSLLSWNPGLSYHITFLFPHCGAPEDLGTVKQIASGCVSPLISTIFRYSLTFPFLFKVYNLT